MRRDFDFKPDGRRAAILDNEMRHRLRDSLSAIARETSLLRLAPKLDLDPPLEALSQGIHSPAMWAWYADLCRAIIVEDSERLLQAARGLSESAVHCAPKGVWNLTDADLGPGCADLFARTVDDNADLPLDLVAVDTSEFHRANGLIAQARDLIGRACPDLLVEIDTFAGRIILAAGPPGGTVFSGAASVFLWGAILLNPVAIEDPVSMVEAIAHESAHALLSGLTGGADLTTNDPDEKYPSPLRADLRPIEGIAHATFVLARMVLALESLARPDLLGAKGRQKLAAMLETNNRLFDAAAAITKKHAQFTDEGSEIFESCFDWMAARA